MFLGVGFLGSRRQGSRFWGVRNVAQALTLDSGLDELHSIQEIYVSGIRRVARKKCRMNLRTKKSSVIAPKSKNKFCWLGAVLSAEFLGLGQIVTATAQEPSNESPALPNPEFLPVNHRIHG